MVGPDPPLEIAKDGSQFQFRQYIEIGMGDVHRRIRKDDYLRNLDVDTFARKGGRSSARQLCQSVPRRERPQPARTSAATGGPSGTPARPWKIGLDPWIAASKAAHQADYAPMAGIIREQVIGEQERRNQRAAQEHLRVIDAVIDKTLPIGPTLQPDCDRTRDRSWTRC